MSRLSLTFLGAPEVRRDGQIVTFRSRKALALLIYLVVTGHAHTRDHLAALFWPNHSPTHARSMLRSTLAWLRKALAEPKALDRPCLLRISGAMLSFKATPEVDLDLGILCTDVQAIQASDSVDNCVIAHLERCVSLYRGDFLTGFSLSDAPAFDDWAGVQREYWHRRMSMVFEHLVRVQTETGQRRDAIEAATCWVTHDPLHESAYRWLMQLHSAAGDRIAALRVYETCCATLAAELDAEPAPSTLALAERIRLDDMAAPGRRYARMPRMELERSLVESSAPFALPLVGRAAEYGTLIEHYYLARSGQAQVVILIGEAGVGKTRLATDFLHWAAAQDADVLVGQAFETSDHISYGPLVDLLRPRVERERAPDDLLADTWLIELSRLLPELRDRYPDLPLAAVDESTAHTRLLEAVARLLEALAAAAPLVLFVDALQSADVDSLNAFSYIGRHLADRHAPLLMIFSLETEALATLPGLEKWIASLERNLPVSRLALGPLTTEDIERLVVAVGAADRAREVGGRQAADLGPFARWLFAETGGQPFFVQETLKTLLEHGMLTIQRRADGIPSLDLANATWQEQPPGRVLPPCVCSFIRTRMARLSAAARNVVEVGAVLGQRFTLACLCQVANSSEHEALTILDELVRYHLLCEEGQTADGATSHYSFAYSKIREFVYAEIGDARRRIFHQRALHALQIAQAPPATLALHARAAGLAEPATQPTPAAQNDMSLAGWWPPLATYTEMLTLVLKTQEPAAKIKAFNRLVSLVAQQVFNNQDWEGYPL